MILNEHEILKLIKQGESLTLEFKECRNALSKDVYATAMWAILYEWAEEGLKRGIKGIFGPGSVLLTGVPEACASAST